MSTPAETQTHATNVKWMHWMIDVAGVVERYSADHGVSVEEAVHHLSNHPDIDDPLLPHYCVHAAKHQALLWERIDTRCQPLDEILKDTLN